MELAARRGCIVYAELRVEVVLEDAVDRFGQVLFGNACRQANQVAEPLSRDLVSHAEFIAESSIYPEAVVVAVEKQLVEVGGGFGEEIRPALVLFGMLSVCGEADCSTKGADPERGDVGGGSLHAPLIVSLQA